MANSTDRDHLPNPDGVDLAFASQACDIDAVPGLVAEISAFGKNVSDLDRKTRLEFLEKARSLVRALEAPRETMLKHVGGQTATFFSLNIGREMGLFKLMAASPDRSQSVAELAAALNCEYDFLARFLRHLGAMGYVSQTGPDEYKCTNFTRAMAIPLIADGYPVYNTGCLEPMIYFSQWLKINGYRSPQAIQGSPFMFGHKTSEPWFGWMRSNETLTRQFNHHMGGYRLGRPAWMDPEVYPVAKNLVAGFEHPQNQTEPTLLVDIGGSYGHDLAEFHRKFPDAPGRLVLQDLPHVLEQITQLDENIHRMPHSFLNPQPVKGARAYYMHQIMHDYPDDRCVEIIEQIKSAMTPGYSRLLINEHIIPPTQASWEATYLDLYMMVMLSARERTQDDWRRLLQDQCGLKILGFWDPGHGVEGIIECELSE